MLEHVIETDPLDSDAYGSAIDELRPRLFELQRACWERDLGALIVVEGWRAAGKGKVIKKLTSRLEPRAFDIHVIRERRTHEKPLPWLYRFWNAIPAYGRFAVFDRSWNRRVLVRALDGSLTDADVQQAYDDITDFERALHDDRYVVIKLFLHIDRETQRNRLEERAADEAESWRVSDQDWQQNDDYEEHLAVVEAMLAETESEWAPWHVIAAYDLRRARVDAFEVVIGRLEQELAGRAGDSDEAGDDNDAGVRKDAGAANDDADDDGRDG